MKTQFVNTIKTGHMVDDIFVLSQKTLSRKKDGNAYLSAVVSDKSGSIPCVAWDNIDQLSSAAGPGDFVHLKGAATEFRGSAQVVIEQLSACPPDSVDPADFIPATIHNVDRMFDRLVRLADAMTSEDLKRLLRTFWDDAAFVRSFKTAPAAKKMHHAYIGGLLEHTLSMAILVERIAGHYSGIDMDLLLTGAMLHDIGKVREFEYATRIDYTDEGRLLNHIVIGCRMIDDRIRMLPEFPEKTAMLLKHLIVSHHGFREFGSPEPPKTMEAVLLNYIDEIDAKVNGIRDFITSASNGDGWTPFNQAMGRHFYKGSNSKQ